MAKILVTGGPVHAPLDAVKIVTNRFRGGRMAELAVELTRRGHHVTYLCTRGSAQPRLDPILDQHPLRINVVHHDGFAEYREAVLLLAPEHEMVVLGAAVANLLPAPSGWRLDEKFPSHQFREGDVVPIPFIVAPRIINQVRAVAPKTTLVGFKLLSGVEDEELVGAALTVLKEARADFVIANDARFLDRKLVLTKERSVVTIEHTKGLVSFLSEAANDVHYRTEFIEQDYSDDEVLVARRDAAVAYLDVMHDFGGEITKYGRQADGLLLGCIATRVKTGGFVCSGRGKKSLAEAVYVREVNHNTHVVTVQVPGGGWKEKATLNAPLLERIFARNPDVVTIVHTHLTNTDLPKHVYAPPGTVRDSLRNGINGDFEIANHGTFRLFMRIR